jgi:NAD(P)-dependent dehydrogenase (short-subunit alcohol dehydrogenase family)
VGQKPAVFDLIKETHRTMGRLNIVISNAGWTRVTNVLDLAEGTQNDDWDRCFVFNCQDAPLAG